MNLNTRNRFRLFAAAVLWNDREDCECQNKGSYPFE